MVEDNSEEASVAPSSGAEAQPVPMDIYPHTERECYFLFNAIIEWGAEETSFFKISQILVVNDFIRDDETYDPKRLSPGALKDLYLRLWQEELKRPDPSLQGGSAMASKKGNPEAVLRQKLIRFKDALYRRYAERMIREINEDDDAYEQAIQEKGEIERGEWDDRPEMLAASGTAVKPSEPLYSNTNGSKQATPVQNPIGRPSSSDIVSRSSTPLAPPMVKTQGLVSNGPNPRDSPVAPVPSFGHKPPNGTLNSPGFPYQGVNGQHGPPPSMQQGHQGGMAYTWADPYVAGPSQQPNMYPPSQHQQGQHQQGQHQQGQQSQPYSPYNSQSGQYASSNYTQPPRTPFSPHGPPPQHLLLPSSPHNSPHPPQANGIGHLPPQNNVPRPDGIPTENPADLVNQQYRPPSGSPLPSGLQQGPQTPGGSFAPSFTPLQRPPSGHHQPGPPQQQWNPQLSPNYQGQTAPSHFQAMSHQPYYPGQKPFFPPTQSPSQPLNQPLGQPQGPGLNRPQHQPQGQFQSQPPTPTQNHPPQGFQPRSDLVGPGSQFYSSPYNPGQDPRLIQSGSFTPAPGSHSGLSNNPRTPMSQIQFAPNSQFQTGSGTKWTPIRHGATPKICKPLSPPVMEPLSPPPSQPAALAVPQKTAKTPKAPKPKAQKKAAQRTRTESTASSVRSKKARSQSVASHVEAPGEPSPLKDTSHVKEEASTPKTLHDEETGNTTADDSNSLPPLANTNKKSTTRPKRQSNIATTPSHGKRKRSKSPVEHIATPVGITDVGVRGTPAGASRPQTHVMWTRNFLKISSSALEEIGLHRYANMFANPVKESQVPGYTSMVLRPQDLKSIKAAIVAGNRAAIEQEKTLDDPHSSERSVWLPISEDLIPPKGIINHTQLDKELMRIYTNAIMFNPDPGRVYGALLGGSKNKQRDATYEIDEDSVVKETREMFEDVRKTVETLRETHKPMPPIPRARGSSTVRGASVRGSSVVRREESVAQSSMRGSSVAPTEHDIDDSVMDMENASTAGSVRGSVRGRKSRRLA